MSISRYMVGCIGAILLALGAYMYVHTQVELRGGNISSGDVAALAENAATASGSFASYTVAQEAAQKGESLPLPPRTPPDGFREYRNTKYDFSLLYPSTLAVSTHDEGGGASTITFENAKEEKGFQIFVVPYAGQSVSPDRFKRDSPSGVMREPVELNIDGVRVTMFFGKDALLGETREVWFIKNGYLFEVTTLKPLDNWLGEIMLTWKFI